MAKTRRIKSDRILFWALGFLVVFGYIMVISAHTGVALEHGTAFFIKEIAKITIFIIGGFFLMLVVRRGFSIEWFVKHIRIISIAIVLMMFATLLFPAQGGAQAWIRLPGVTIQPVEFLKLFMIIYLAYYFGIFYNKKAEVSRVLLLPLLLTTISVFFVFIIQNDLGSALILLMIVLCMIFALPEKKYNRVKIILLVAMIAFIVLFIYLVLHLAK